MTFSECSEQWLAVKQMDVGKSQLCAYKCALKHLQPIYSRDIQTIRVNDIQAIIADLARYNPNTKKPTSKKTLYDIKHTAKQILQYGIDMQIISYNAAQSVKIPRSAPKETRRALTDQERKIITETPHKLRTASMIMLYAGLRRGEVIPLEWSDIDTENGTISVNKAVDLSGNTPIIKTPKTAAGTRIIHMPSILTEYLASIPRSGTYVIYDRLMTKEIWIKQWDKYVKLLEIPEVTAHMLRHTACTMMIESGMDVASVKTQMGHSNIKTTLDIYTHVTQMHRATEIEKLNSYLKTISP